MSTYLCHVCAKRDGLIAPYSGILSSDEPDEFVKTSYQVEKFLKHTVPKFHLGYVSIFSDPELEKYAQYTVSAAASGCVEIDSSGRTNLIVYAGQDNGFTLCQGKIQFPTDSTKLVLSHNADKFHSYPVSADHYTIYRCQNCGKDILG